MNDILASIIVFILALFVIVILFAPLSWWECHAKWDDSGMPVRWHLGAGCQVQVNGNWIPATSYRSL